MKQYSKNQSYGIIHLNRLTSQLRFGLWSVTMATYCMGEEICSDIHQIIFIHFILNSDYILKFPLKSAKIWSSTSWFCNVLYYYKVNEAFQMLVYDRIFRHFGYAKGVRLLWNTISSELTFENQSVFMNNASLLITTSDKKEILLWTVAWG